MKLVPPRAHKALDLGCGDGSFAAALSARCSTVVALDREDTQVELARQRCADLPGVSVLRADFLSSGLRDEEFDLVTALAAFHHAPIPEAAHEVSRLLKPGGRLIVLGIWTDSSRRDVLWNAASVLLNRYLRARRGPDTMTAPATLERTSWVETKAVAAECLPGARLRRRLLWRYTLVWDKPATSGRDCRSGG
jgi:SAM-dependent methyltransferase